MLFWNGVKQNKVFRVANLLKLVDSGSGNLFNLPLVVKMLPNLLHIQLKKLDGVYTGRECSVMLLMKTVAYDESCF